MQGAHAYILDLDGTLLPSDEIDNRCYWRAVRAVYGAPARTPSLDGFRHVTDIGILDQWCRETLGRPPTAAELDRVKSSFLDFTRDAMSSHPDSFAPVPGIRSWLQRQHQAGCPVAIATGGWGHTARLKLAASGLDASGLPLSSADDAVSRTAIMRRSLERLGGAARVTYIGDGVWDLRAASSLGWAFIGRASGHRAQVLREAGATRVVEDFRALT